MKAYIQSLQEKSSDPSLKTSETSDKLHELKLQENLDTD